MGHWNPGPPAPRAAKILQATRPWVTEVAVTTTPPEPTPTKTRNRTLQGFEDPSPTRPAHRTAITRGFGALLALSLTACATTQGPQPDWPAQPTPAYPEPPASDGPVVAPTESAKSEGFGKAPASTSGNSLAKQYDGKKALETLEGKATYYADSLAGNHTASGEPYDPKAFTAAHKKLPFGTVVRVIRVDDGSVTYVRINDRGPFGPKERIIDLSRAAAEELGMLRAGVVRVRVEIVKRGA